MFTPNSDQLAGYHEALSGSAFFTWPNGGYLQILGPDREDFLQRQTTNDIRLLTPGRVLQTILTSPKARILDVLTLIQESERLGAITLPGNAAKTAQFLKSRIFFMDDVTVKNRSSMVKQIDLIGPHTGQILATLGITQILEPDQWIVLDHHGHSVVVVRQRGLAEHTYRFLCPSEAAAHLVDHIVEKGTAELSAQSRDILRVEAGVPAAENELIDAYTPLEIGREADISSTKGCYTGQEVIARQITYDKVTRKLVGIQSKNVLQKGDAVWVEGKSVGQVTSAVQSPRFGPIALAVIKRPHNHPDTRVRVGEQDPGIFGLVAALPFDKV